jgi:hypothetical protein
MLCSWEEPSWQADGGGSSRLGGTEVVELGEPLEGGGERRLREARSLAAVRRKTVEGGEPGRESRGYRGVRACRCGWGLRNRRSSSGRWEYGYER